MKGSQQGFAFVDVRAANFNATTFVKKAQTYEGVNIRIMRIGDTKQQDVNAKSLLGVLSLSPKDKDIRILVSGTDGLRNRAICDELKVIIA